MPSLALHYSDGVLEIQFVTDGEALSRMVTLNDHIFLWTDSSITAAGGLTLASYPRLVQVNETHLSGIRELDDEEAERCLDLLSTCPVNRLIDVTDRDELIARVLSPNLEDLLETMEDEQN